MARLITISDAAKRLGVTGQTIRNWADDGVLDIFKHGRAYYVNADTIKNISADVECTEKARRRLEEYRERYEQEWREIREERMLETAKRRYFRYSEPFFDIAIDILLACGVIKDREGFILRENLHGKHLEDIAQKLGLGRERVRQMREKAIAKARDLESVRERMLRVVELEEKNRELSKSLSLFRDNKKDDSEIGRLYTLIKKRVVDMFFSVRVENILRSLDVDTVGDLCRMKKSDFLSARHAGRVSLREVEGFFKVNNLSWGMDVDGIIKEYHLTNVVTTVNA